MFSFRFHAVLCAALWVSIAGCSSSPVSSARQKYNDGIDWLVEGDLEAAERSFLDARNSAGGDQKVRYSAAFNMGMLHARKADELELSEPENALKALVQARHWFQDAARVRSDDTDSRVNLDIVGRKAQVLADQINQGDKKLETRLDRVIEEERALRDQVRVLMEEVKQSGTEADPIAFRARFTGLATDERVLMAEVGVVRDLTADELAGLDGQVPEEMEPQDRMRQVQLRNLDAFLESARVAVDDTRRALRKLNVERSHSRATAALADLKRAREQLLDPVAALKAVAQDQEPVLTHSIAYRELGKKTLSTADNAEGPAVRPAWLDTEHLAERQTSIWERGSQVLSQFQAVAHSPPPEDAGTASPETARMLELAAEAVPMLEASVGAMDEARKALESDSIESAISHESDAMRSLLRAIEYFSDLRNLIELTHAEQLAVIAMLDPEAASKIPMVAKMTTDDRARESREAIQRNLDRLRRMIALIEKESSEAQASSSEAQASSSEAAAEANEQNEQEDSTRKLYESAERHRAAAAASLGTVSESLQAIIRKTRAQSVQSPLIGAQSAQEHIEALRRIFYTVVEHLKELHREQGQTYDETGTAQTVDEEKRAATLPLVAEAQQRHSGLADALATALEKQSDAAAAADDPQAAQEAEKFSAAAVEVRSALSAMKSASELLNTAAGAAESMSVDLSPVLDDQPVALEHLAAAIQILEPPNNKEDEGEDQQEQEEGDDEKEQEEQQEESSKEQAEKRMQEIRDREAERQRDREKKQQVQSAGVEKDW